jgi:protein-tyrosine phosphatase
MRALLITDCLQHDFVGPVDRFEGLPNALHEGHDESRRLLGLRVDWMPKAFTGDGRLGLTIVPGRRDYERSLEADLDSLCESGIQAVLCLLSHDEFERYGVVGLLDRYRNEGMDVLHLPTIDRTPPSDDSLDQAMTWISGHVAAGRSVLVHCVGGLGRAGTVAGCWPRQHGLSGDEAIRVVREFRSPRAIETFQQEQAIHLCRG